MLILFECASIILVVLCTSQVGEASRKTIEALPGLSFKPTFSHYSGYLQASDTHYLFYWFVESQNNPITDPLIFWFNGGPGCSSLDGLLGVMGPYLINDDGETLRENPNAWTKFANVVYLDAPAGTGFSYSTDGNITTNDDQTADENYVAIKLLFKEFPAFRNHSVFITGESYVGVYVPMLAERIADGGAQFPVNLKGIAIGNGALIGQLTNLHRRTWIQFAYGYGFVSEREWKTFEMDCCNGSLSLCDTLNLDEKCLKVGAAFSHRVMRSGVNIYDVQEPCDKNSTLFVMCRNVSAMTTYLNSAKIREALALPSHVGTWEACAKFSDVDYPQKHDENMSEPILRIIRENVSVLLFYGDTDFVCNFLMGQQFAASLGLPLVKEKTAWHFNNQVAGFKTVYDGMTFITVRGAGHQERAPETMHAIKQFTAGQPI